MAIKLPPDFKEFLKLCNDHQVEYIVVGGYAVGYHGYPRSTNDLDIWIAISPQNAQKMVEVLREFGFDVPKLSESLFLNQKNIVRFGVPPMRIEIISEASGINFDECYRSRISDLLDGVQVNLLDLHHLIINKKAAGRFKDLADIEALGGHPINDEI